jgi:hopanoid biosynthesis associated protein HpnK
LKRAIITGDDFGLALPVNEAIIDAHCRGILTSASIMPGERWFEDAVEKARSHPTLSVGLHLTLVEGHSVLSHDQTPDLTDANGAFSPHLAQAGFKFFFYPGIRKQLEAEIRAQFEAFRKTGLPLDHADAHNHMHLHPTILRLLLKVGKEYGLKAVRLPNEPPLLSWKASRKWFGSRMGSAAFLSPWIVLMKQMLRRAEMRHNDYLLGMTDSGAMTADLIMRLIGKLAGGTYEFCFHPAMRRSTEINLTMPDYRHEDEYKTLIDPSLKEAFEKAQVHRISYSSL